MAQLTQAFSIDQNNLAAVYLLAKVAILRGEPERMETLAKHGLSLLGYLNTALLIQLQRSEESVNEQSEGYYLTLHHYESLFKLKSQFLFFLGMRAHSQG